MSSASVGVGLKMKESIVTMRTLIWRDMYSGIVFVRTMEKGNNRKRNISASSLQDSLTPKRRTQKNCVTQNEPSVLVQSGPGEPQQTRE